MAKMVKKSVAPFYLAAAVWLLWSFFLPLWRGTHYVLCAAASVAVLLVGRALFPDKTYALPEKQGEETAAAPAAEEKKRASTGDGELDELLRQRDTALSELKRLNDAIRDPGLSAQIDHLEAVTGKIFGHVAEHPEKKPQISRFMSYYLPTTLKLLNAYDRMDDAGVSGVNIDGTKGKIETMMATVTAAFDKQLDALFGDVAMDISTDITVMENLLRQEGLNSDGTLTMGQ